MPTPTVQIDLNGGGSHHGVDQSTTYDESGSPNPTQTLFSSADVNTSHGGELQSVTLTLSDWTNTESFSLTSGAQTAATNAHINITTNANGVLTLTWDNTNGNPTANEWESVLRGIQFTNTADVPLGTSQTITITGVGDNVTAGMDTINVTCFYGGTLVATPSGAVAVETIKSGDLVLTRDGRAMPVTWLGRQTVSRLFADPLRVLPIRIKAGALADNVPSRDLLLSPDHAVLVDGALIHAGALVNGTSIRRETAVPRNFVYYHIEVDDHSLILAENTPAETFIDNVDRMNFDNWAEHQALYPEGKPINELPYPRAKAHRQVPVATRVKLGERAQAIGAAADVAAA